MSVKQGLSKLKEVYDKPKGEYEPNLVNILGEQVSFVDTGLSESEQIIVPFEKYYRPDKLDEQDFELLKRTMRQVFAGLSKELRDPSTGEVLEGDLSETTSADPYPPCGEREKYLVLASLLHRAKLLRQQLYEMGILNKEQLLNRIEELNTSGKEKDIQGADTVLARTHLNHLDKLQKFIDKYLDEQKCINIGDIAYQDLELDLNDERVKELLKQFVFFILQGHYPLEAYRKTNPTAPGFIGRLEKNPLKDFGKFMEDYKKTGSPIPESIAKVLESTNMDEKTMQAAVDAKIQEEKKKLIQDILKRFPSNDPFLASIKGITDPVTIVDRLRERLQEFQKEISTLKNEKLALEKRAQDCDKALAALRLEKQRVDKQVADGLATLELMKGNEAMVAQLKEQQQSAQQEIQKKVDELTTLRNEYNARALDMDTRINGLTVNNQALQDENQTLQERLRVLEDTQAKNEVSVLKLQEEYQAKLNKATLLADERQKAVLAAQDAQGVAENELREKIAELETAQANFNTQKELMGKKELQIIELTQKVSDAEKAVTTNNEEMSKLKEQLNQVKADLDTQTKLVQEKSEAILDIQTNLDTQTSKVGTQSSQLEAKEQELEKLTKEKQQAVKEATDCAAREAGLLAQIKTLEETSSGDVQKVGTLTQQLETLRKEKTELEFETNQQKSELDALAKKLETEEQQSKEKDETISKLRKELVMTSKALKTLPYIHANETNKLKETIETQSGQIKTLEQTVEQKDQQLKTKQADFDASLDKNRQMFEQSLQRTKEQYASIFNEAKAELTGMTNRYVEENQQKELLKDAIKDIAESIGTNTPVVISDDVDESKSLRDIVTALTSKTGTAVPRSISVDPSLNHCYLITLATFLWNLNFVNEDAHAKVIKDILVETFNGGKHQRTSITLNGLYSDFGCGAKSTTTSSCTGPSQEAKNLAEAFPEDKEQCVCLCEEGKACSAVYGLQETATIKYFLEFFSLLMTTMTKDPSNLTELKRIAYKSNKGDPTQYEGGKAIDEAKQIKFIHFIKQFEAKLNVFFNEHKSIYQKESKTDQTAIMSKGFLQICNEHLLEKFKPVGATELLSRYVILPKGKTGDIPTIDLQWKDPAGKDKTPLSNLNYAVLFYAFLIVLRDYLNKVKNSSPCPLPKVLEK